jgi:hypothetical protein
VLNRAKVLLLALTKFKPAAKFDFSIHTQIYRVLTGSDETRSSEGENEVQVTSSKFAKVDVSVLIRLASEDRLFAIIADGKCQPVFARSDAGKKHEGKPLDLFVKVSD